MVERIVVQNLNPKRATEPPGGIVRFCAIVGHEDMAVAVISKDGATEFSNISRCFQPARCFRIEISKFLPTLDIAPLIKVQCRWQQPCQ